MVLLSYFDVDCMLECEFPRILGFIPCFNEKPWASLNILVCILCVLWEYNLVGIDYVLFFVRCYYC